MVSPRVLSGGGPGKGARRVLIVEDDPVIRSAIAGLFAEEGYDVSVACNGREAIEHLRTGRQPPDIILLDLMMPVMDGWEFRTVQRADPIMADIPVIAISADTSPKAAAIHADVYLCKPFRGRELLAKAARILDERERRSADSEQPLVTLGTLSATILHEVNSPLAAVFANLCLAEQSLPLLHGGLEVVARSNLDPAAASATDTLHKELSEVAEVVRDARSGAERMRDLLQRLRSYARATQEARVPVYIQDLVCKAVQMAASELRPRARVELSIDSPPPVLGDEAHLTQVVLHLLLNAAQALPPDGAQENTVSVRVRGAEARAIVEVQDTGTGMSEVAQQRIFEPFFSDKPPEPGAAMGLSACRAVIEAHGGYVEIETGRDRGTLVRLNLPTAATADSDIS